MSKITISQHFDNPSVSKFLDKQLGERKGEFVSNVIALSNSNTDLSKCSPPDLMMCAMNATALNLPLNQNLGYAYVIPYNKKLKNDQGEWITVSEPQFQIGYKGFIQLAIRSAMYKTINACEVRDGEIERNKFTGEITVNGEKPDNNIVGYLASLKLLNGFEQSLYMTTEEITDHAKKYSKSFAKYGNGLWKDDFDKMAKKTVLKLLISKYGVVSTELQKAVIMDQQVSGEYKDNPNIIDITETIEEKKEKMKNSKQQEITLP